MTVSSLPNLPRTDGRRLMAGLFETLRCQLQLMAPGDMLPTERELAEFYGVGYSTVRRVTDRLQREGLLKKIPGSGSFAAERPEDAAKTAGGTLVYADPWDVKGNAYFTRCLQGIVEAAGEFGMRLRVFRIGHESVESLLTLLRQPEVRGLLAPWLHNRTIEFVATERPDLRVVTMGRRFPAPGMASVMIDFAALGYQACRHLHLGRGARRPVLVMANADTGPGWEAYREAAKSPCPAALVKTSPQPEDPQAICRELAALETDGVAFDDDRLAAACLPFIAEGLPLVSLANIGEDLLPPRVARLTIDGFDIGSGAVQLLGQMLKEGRAITVASLIQPRLEAPVASLPAPPEKPPASATSPTPHS